MGENSANRKLEGGLVYGDDSYRLIGACFEVYNRMGCGFLEAVYQECLEIELSFLSACFALSVSRDSVKFEGPYV